MIDSGGELDYTNSGAKKTRSNSNLFENDKTLENFWIKFYCCWRVYGSCILRDNRNQYCDIQWCKYCSGLYLHLLHVYFFFFFFDKIRDDCR